MAEVTAEVSQQIQAAAQCRTSEFHERLKSHVRKLTCDLMSKEESIAYAAGLSRADLERLVYVMNAELHQVVAAVNEGA